MVALEAMAVGCPTVTTDVSAIRESVGSSGITVPPGDIAGAARAVQSLLDKATRDEWADKGRRHASQFSAEHCAEKIVDIVQQQLGLTNGPAE